MDSQYSFQSPARGLFLYSMVKRFKPIKTLGIGFGYGVPALYICQAHFDLGRQNESHVVIDPTQATRSKGIGVQSIRRAGLAHILSHRELSDFVALPMAHQMEERFQFVLIEDTRHTDYTMVDAFFADLLLDIGGFIVFVCFVEDQDHLVAQFLATNRAYRHVNEADIGFELMELLSISNLHVLIKQEHYDHTAQEPPTRAAVFDKIYTDNYWHGGGSGDGSNPLFLKEYYNLIRRMVRSHSIYSIVDLGCGDLQSLAFWKGLDVDYTGYDVSHIQVKNKIKIKCV